MLQDLTEGAGVIFNYKELLKEIVVISLNSPDEYLDKVFGIYEEFVDLVESFAEYDEDELNEFINDKLPEYWDKPYFPMLAGLYVNALLNRLFRNTEEIALDLKNLNNTVLRNAGLEAGMPGKGGAAPAYRNSEGGDQGGKVPYSLDFIGYLLPEGKKLIIYGDVGDYCGALMEARSVFMLYGRHGQYFGYASDPTAERIVKSE